MGMGSVRVPSNGAFSERDACRHVARLIIEKTQVVRGVRVLRAQVQRLAVQRFGGGVLADPVYGQSPDREVVRRRANGQRVEKNGGSRSVKGSPDKWADRVLWRNCCLACVVRMGCRRHG